MNHRVRISTFFILISFASYGQQFSGRVLDRENHEPIPFADIYFPELQTGVTADENGKFILNDLLDSKINIRISFLGYQTLQEVIDLKTTSHKDFYLNKSLIRLQEVIVSVPQGRLQGENIVNIDRRGLELVKTPFVTLATAIGDIAGVDQSTTGQGIGKPVIRGLSGSRIVTYAQGIRIENQQWGDEHGLGIPELGIGSVEVIKGPASLLYGSDALGGVLYFVDEKYTQHNQVEGNIGTVFFSNTLGSHNQLDFKLHKEGFKINVYGGYSTDADYAVPHDGRVTNTRFDARSFKTSVGYNAKKWITNIRYSFLHNNFGITEDSEYSHITTRRPQLPFQKVAQHTLSFDNTIFVGDSHLNLVLGYGQNNRSEFEEDETNPSLDMKLRTFTYDFKWYSAPFKNHFNIIAGLQGMNRNNKNYGEERLIPDAATNDIGLFSMVTYDLSSLKLQAGVRADFRDINAKAYQSPDTSFPDFNKTYGSFNYSAGGVYSTDMITLRMNLSSGYRAPNTSELLSDGVHEGTQRYEKGNISLKSEYSTQLDFTFDFHTNHVEFTVNPFYNHINNYIYLSPTDSSINNVPVYVYTQSDARLYGGEAGIHIHPHPVHWLHISSNLSVVMAEDPGGNPLPMIPATRINTMIKAEIHPKGNFRVTEVYIQDVYKFAQNRTGAFETSTPAYNLVNLGANIEIATKGKPIEISTGVKNLFNVRYIDHLSRLKTLNIPNPGINIYVGMKFGFMKKTG